MPASKTRMYEYAKRVSKLRSEVLFRVIFSINEIKEEIIYLNTQEQLFEKGIDSEGVRLDVARGYGYANVTKKIKAQKGQPTDRITLKDTGEFYQSFRVDVREGVITINADAQKDDTNLFDEWGVDILGLTEESIKRLKPLVIENYKKYILGLLG